MGSGTSGTKSMRSPILVDGSDLDGWARRRDAQQVLPQLVRRLLHGSVDRDRIVRASFPAGEGIQRRGWDGIAIVEKGNAFVPDGTSGWELSATEDVRRKSDEDYQKRTDNPGELDPATSTFVFVTPRRWGGNDAWAAARRAEGRWRELRAYDADDLEQWLELAPPVHLWFSRLLGKRPAGVVDLETWWNDWSGTTTPPTSPGVVLAGRAEVAAGVRAWLRGAEPTLALEAESREEALAVFAAALGRLPAEEQVGYVSRAAVVHERDAWNELVASKEPLLLVRSFEGARSGRASAPLRSPGRRSARADGRLH